MFFEDIFGGFVTLFSDPYAIWFVFLAAFVGIVFGALPGLTAAAAIAMMLPILIAYNDEIGGLAGLAFLYVIGCSQTFLFRAGFELPAQGFRNTNGFGFLKEVSC